MKELIFPGYSIKNKDWAETTKKDLASQFNFEIVYWKHWETGRTDEIDLRDPLSVVKLIGDEKFNLLAKSVGSLLAMQVFQNVRPEKFILCGVPLIDLDENDKKFYEILKDFDANKILCIQNDEDPHGRYEEVEKFVHSINPNIRIILKANADHEYYYPEEFLLFLKR